MEASRTNRPISTSDSYRYAINSIYNIADAIGNVIHYLTYPYTLEIIIFKFYFGFFVK